MNSSELTKQQVQDIRDRLAPTLGYLSRLLDRINETHFPHDDPLRHHVTKAQAAMQGLVMNLHYLSCNEVRPRWRPGLGSAEQDREVD